MKDQNTLIWGDYNAVCDICGFKHKASDLRESGDLGKRGLKVCSKCYDPLHMQDILRGRADNPSVPWARPDTSPAVSGPNNIAGLAIATGAISGHFLTYFNPL